MSQNPNLDYQMSVDDTRLREIYDKFATSQDHNGYPIMSYEDFIEGFLGLYKIHDNVNETYSSGIDHKQRPGTPLNIIKKRAWHENEEKNSPNEQLNLTENEDSQGKKGETGMTVITTEPKNSDKEPAPVPEPEPVKPNISMRKETLYRFARMRMLVNNKGKR